MMDLQLVRKGPALPSRSARTMMIARYPSVTRLRVAKMKSRLEATAPVREPAATDRGWDDLRREAGHFAHTPLAPG